jgi:uncharacterized membrane-anchored protein YjiN (DUF445 family)
MSLIEQTQTVVDNVVNDVVNTLVETVTEPVVVEPVVVAKKSLKPKNVNAAHFKWMTFAYWMLRQIEATASESEMSSWMKMIGVGAATEDIKGFYERFLAEQEMTAETLVSVFEEQAAEQKRGRKKKVISILPTYENGADAEVVNANSIVKDLIQLANGDNIVVEPVVVMTVAAPAEKPKRKYTKKPKADTIGIEGPNVMNDIVTNTESVVEPVVENVVTEPVTEPVAEKPKRKYTRKPKAVVETIVTDNVVEPVVETVVETIVTETVVEAVVETVVETIVTESVVEAVVESVVVDAKKPKAKSAKKPKTDTEVVECAEKPKRKYNKKTKDAVVITPQENVPVVSELTNESYVSEHISDAVTEVGDDLMDGLTNAMASTTIEDKPEQEEEQDIAVEIVIINDKKYLMDAEYNVYDMETQNPLGKLVNGVIV